MSPAFGHCYVSTEPSSTARDFPSLTDLCAKWAGGTRLQKAHRDMGVKISDLSPPLPPLADHLAFLIK